jgi:hypothetical protein
MSILNPVNWFRSSAASTATDSKAAAAAAAAPGGAGAAPSTITSADPNASREAIFYRRAFAWVQSTRPYGWVRFAIVWVWNGGCGVFKYVKETVWPAKTEKEATPPATPTTAQKGAAAAASSSKKDAAPTPPPSSPSGKSMTPSREKK